MADQNLLSGVAIGDYVTILNAYGREVRGRVVELHRDGTCTLISATGATLHADPLNTVRVERRADSTKS